jgi:uncharacterized protein (TIGR03437 family)
LTASIATTDIAAAGKGSVSVFNPSTSLGSDSLIFVVNASQMPVVPNGSIVNGASYGGDPPAPGSIGSLFGANLAPGTEAAGAVPLPTILMGVSVSVNNVPAPLFFVSPGQINFQFPWELLGQTQAAVVVSSNGVSSPAVTVPLSSAGPAIFTVNSQGTGQGTVQIANTNVFAAPVGSISGNTSRPATRGVDYISIYCNGLGAIKGTAASGIPGNGETITPARVSIGGVDAPVTYSGLAPGFVGLYQVNALVPSSAPLGSTVPLVITIGTASSNTVTMAVQ